MSKPIFNKKIPASCSYCNYAKVSSTLNLVFCEFKGPVSERDYCRKYSYDPLKRSPKEKAVLPNFSAEDFKL